MAGTTREQVIDSVTREVEYVVGKSHTKCELCTLGEPYQPPEEKMLLNEINRHDGRIKTTGWDWPVTYNWKFEVDDTLKLSANEAAMLDKLKYSARICRDCCNMVVPLWIPRQRLSMYW